MSPTITPTGDQGVCVDESTFYRDHWVAIDDDRLAASEQLYDWPEPFVAAVVTARRA